MSRDEARKNEGLCSVILFWTILLFVLCSNEPGMIHKMVATITADVLQDELAVSLARVMAVANKCARESGIDLLRSLVTITQCPFNGGSIWRINYGPRDYVGRRGGDFIVEVDPISASIKRVLHGQ